MVVTGEKPGRWRSPVPAWVWTEALRALATYVPPAEPAGALGALLDPDARLARPGPFLG